MLPTLQSPNATIQDPGTINVIVGRNGAGKSRFLRDLTSHFRGNPAYNVSYITPERGGTFVYEPHIEVNTLSDPNWLPNNRQQNQSGEFKKSSLNHLRNLSIAWGRRLNDDLELRKTNKTFESEFLADINALFLNVSLVWKNNSFTFESIAGDPIPPNQISSGESEIVSLASEILNFFESIDASKQNILAIDEPDVHLHPDMQARLANFIIKQVAKLAVDKRDMLAVLIATHSTTLSTALSSYSGTKIATKFFDNPTVIPRTMTAHFQQTAKFFAHPLSQIIAEEPLFIIEGGDDTRIFQQAARSSRGRIHMFPVEADSVDQQTALETFCNEVLTAVHDSPVAFSIRDGDGQRNALNAVGCVTRFRLQCYAVENLLLTDDFLASRGSSWPAFQAAALTYAAQLPAGAQRQLLEDVANSADHFRDQKIKDIRTLICVILGSNKPWEFLLGQVIGTMNNPLPQNPAEHSIVSYLGKGLVLAMGFQDSPPPVILAAVPE